MGPVVLEGVARDMSVNTVMDGRMARQYVAISGSGSGIQAEVAFPMLWEYIRSNYARVILWLAGVVIEKLVSAWRTVRCGGFHQGAATTMTSIWHDGQL
jgi:hypothetical protein